MSKLTSARAAELRGVIEAGQLQSLEPSELAAMCREAESMLRMQEHSEQARAEREAREREPNPCEVCGLDIEPGTATYASIAHWSCHVGSPGADS